jgi:hypothetical protein
MCGLYQHQWKLTLIANSVYLIVPLSQYRYCHFEARISGAGTFDGQAIKKNL